MLSLLLTAGSDTNSLAVYVEQEQAMEVLYKYDSLAQSHANINSVLIDVDKLVYVLKEGMQYRNDMASLLKNLTLNNFFSVKEILFICCSDYDNEEALKYFNEVMTKSNYERFKIMTVQDFSFSEVYYAIIGNKDSDRFKPNRKMNIYRRERNNVSDRAYVEDDEILKPENMFELIEPQDLDKIQENLALKGIIKQGENGTLIEDNYEEAAIQLDNVVLPRINIQRDRIKNIVVVTGEPKSGVSTFSHLVSNSALENDLTSIIVDATGSGDTSFIAHKCFQYVNDINFKDFIVESRINLVFGCNIISLDGNDIVTILDKLRFMLVNEHKYQSHVLFVECRLEDLKHITEMLQERLHSVLYCCNTNENSLKNLAKEILPLKGVQNTVLLSNTLAKYSTDFTSEIAPIFQENNIMGSDIRNIFNNANINCKIIKIPRVTTLVNDFKLYDSIVGIRR